MVEVDTTFYRIPDPIRTSEWVRRVVDVPSFLFSVKLFQGFTHTRKASLVESRDVITLDLDNVQPGATESLLRRFGALGCAYATYSTRKHEGVRPRLRLLVPLNRTVNADEYEPIARKLAEFAGVAQP